MSSIFLRWLVDAPQADVHMLGVAIDRVGFYLESLRAVHRSAYIPATYQAELLLAGDIVSPNPDFSFSKKIVPRSGQIHIRMRNEGIRL
jgi:hypothetical protein